MKEENLDKYWWKIVGGEILIENFLWKIFGGNFVQMSEKGILDKFAI